MSVYPCAVYRVSEEPLDCNVYYYDQTPVVSQANEGLFRGRLLLELARLENIRDSRWTRLNSGNGHLILIHTRNTGARLLCAIDHNLACYKHRATIRPLTSSRQHYIHESKDLVLRPSHTRRSIGAVSPFPVPSGKHDPYPGPQ